MEASERILRAWIPAIHAGMTIMTMIRIFMFCGRV
jgi:hypothetical protein